MTKPADLTLDQLAEIEKLAKAATPGTWAVHSQHGLYVVPIEDKHKPIGGASTPERDNEYARLLAKVELYVETFDGREEFTRRNYDREGALSDARHIGSASPSTILALVAMARRAVEPTLVCDACGDSIGVDSECHQPMCDGLMRPYVPKDTGRMTESYEPQPSDSPERSDRT